MWSIHAMHLPKRNGTLTCAAARVNLENTTLCERSQTQRIMYLYEISQTGKSIDRKQPNGGQGEGKYAVTTNGGGVSLDDKNGLELRVMTVV